jgi:hypothetical protein
MRQPVAGVRDHLHESIEKGRRLRLDPAFNRYIKGGSQIPEDETGKKNEDPGDDE